MEWLGAIALAWLVYVFGKSQAFAEAKRTSILGAKNCLKDYEEDYAKQASEWQARSDQRLTTWMNGPLNAEDTKNASRRARIGALISMTHLTGMAQVQALKLPPNEGRDQTRDELKRRLSVTFRSISLTLEEYEADLANAERKTSQQG